MFEFQETGALFLANGGILLADEPGLGKQLAVDTKILTPKGWCPIGELNVGDLVTGSNGKPTSVISVYPQGMKPLYRVSFSDGSSVEAGAEHLWAVEYNAGTTSGGRIVYRIRKILTTAQIAAHPSVTGRRRGGQRLYLPMLSGPAEFIPRKLELNPYLVGALLANGGLTQPSHTTLSLNAADTKHVIGRIPPEVIGSIQSKQTVTAINLLGLVAVTSAIGIRRFSKDKRIPRAYLEAAPTDRIALLQGMMDGDGSITPERNRVIYHTTSHGLAEDVRELVEGLGGIASVRAYDRTHENKPTDYQVRMRLPEWAPPFSTSRKAERYVPGRAAKPGRTVVSVEYVRETEAVCIAVDAPDALYVTEHCILTHNTKQALMAARQMVAETILIVCPAIAVGVWKAEVAKWRPDLTALTVREAIKARRVPRKARVLITSFDHLVATKAVRDRVGSIPHDLLVLDEAHALKNPLAKRTKLIYGPLCAGGFGSLIGRCGATRLLTGTPQLNHVGEWFSHLRALAPDRLAQKSYHAFTHTYCVHGTRSVRTRDGREVTIETIEGSNREMIPDLARRLRGLWLKRKVDDVLTELPPLRVEVRRLSPDALDPAVLAEVEQSGEAEELRRAISTGDPESLRHIEGHMARLRRLLALAKVNATIAWAEGVLDAGELKVAVWGWHVEALERVKAGLAGHNPIMITGATTGRDALVDRFQNDPRCKVGIFQIQAAGTALTMTACRRAIFIEQAWTPALNTQAVKRHHRIGSTNAVLAEILVAPGLDEAVGGILARKTGDIEALEAA